MEHRLIIWLCCWVDLFTAAIRIVSFNLIDPSIDYDFRTWELVRQMKKRTMLREEKKREYREINNKIQSQYQPPHSNEE